MVEDQPDDEQRSPRLSPPLHPSILLRLRQTMVLADQRPPGDHGQLT